MGFFRRLGESAIETLRAVPAHVTAMVDAGRDLLIAAVAREHLPHEPNLAQRVQIQAITAHLTALEDPEIGFGPNLETFNDPEHPHLGALNNLIVNLNLYQQEDPAIFRAVVNTHNAVFRRRLGILMAQP